MLFEALVEDVIPQKLFVVVKGVAAPKVSQSLHVLLGGLVRKILLLTHQPLLVLLLFSPEKL